MTYKVELESVQHNNITTEMASRPEQSQDGVASLVLNRQRLPERLRNMSIADFAKYVICMALITIVTIVTEYLTEKDILGRFLNRTCSQ